MPSRKELLIDRLSRLGERELYLDACGHLKYLWEHPSSSDSVVNKVIDEHKDALKNALKIVEDYLEKGNRHNFFCDESRLRAWQVFGFVLHYLQRPVSLGNSHLIRAMVLWALPHSNGQRDREASQEPRRSAAASANPSASRNFRWTQVSR